jgi:membrane protein implicated in regulation of membrane protease activity
MTWSDFYLFCFIMGFALSVLSFLAGATHMHLPFRLHLPFHGGGHHVGGFAKGIPTSGHGHGPGAPTGTASRGSPNAGHVSWFNMSTAMAFLAWFGGTGYILSRESHLVAIASLGFATLAGLVAGWLVFKVMVKLMRANDSQMNDADYRLEGSVGTISIPVRKDGTGEVIFSLGGVRRSLGARSDGGMSIEKGAEVVIERCDKGIAYVKPWDEFTR